jgi:hypothetical protein
MIPTDYGEIYPKLNGYLIRPLLASPPMCELKDLQNGVYNINDLEVMHQILDLRSHMNPIRTPP